MRKGDKYWIISERKLHFCPKCIFQPHFTQCGREKKKESLWISIKWSLGREGCVRVGELMCRGQMFNNNGRTGPAEKHTFHPLHPTVAVGTHTRTDTQIHTGPHTQTLTYNHSYVDVHNNDSCTHTVQSNVWQPHTCTHSPTDAGITTGLCVYVCVRVFMTSAGHSAYGPHLGTMGMENDWLDELPDCERWLEAC